MREAGKQLVKPSRLAHSARASKSMFSFEGGFHRTAMKEALKRGL
jgi:hypothetical protein